MRLPWDDVEPESSSVVLFAIIYSETFHLAIYVDFILTPTNNQPNALMAVVCFSRKTSLTIKQKRFRNGRKEQNRVSVMAWGSTFSTSQSNADLWVCWSNKPHSCRHDTKQKDFNGFVAKYSIKCQTFIKSMLKLFRYWKTNTFPRRCCKLYARSV